MLGSHATKCCMAYYYHRFQSTFVTHPGISGYKMLHGILLTQIPVYICHSPWDLLLQNAAWHIIITDSSQHLSLTLGSLATKCCMAYYYQRFSLYVTHMLGSHTTKCCMAYYYHRFQSTFATHLGISRYKMLHGILLSQIQSICDTYAGISGYKMLHGILLSQIPVYICHSPWDLTLQNAAWHITITDSVYM